VVTTHQLYHRSVKRHGEHHDFVYVGSAGPFSPLDVVQNEGDVPVFAHTSARELLGRIHDWVYSAFCIIQQAFGGEPQDRRGREPRP
jgi:hypothetical protein